MGRAQAPTRVPASRTVSGDVVCDALEVCFGLDGKEDRHYLARCSLSFAAYFTSRRSSTFFAVPPLPLANPLATSSQSPSSTLAPRWSSSPSSLTASLT